MNARRPRVLIAVLLLSSLSAAATCYSQTPKPNEEFDPETTTRVTLGGASGTPGTVVVVPIYFTPARNVAVGRLRVEVTYVSVNLKFSKLDKGIAAELGGVDVAVEARGGKTDKGLETQTLVVTASFLNPPPPTGIPSGLLAYITFNVGQDGRPASIGLRPTAEAVLVRSNQPVPNLRAFQTQVDVLAPGTQPLISCFFFTH
jgi:hypothetical protein